MGKTTITKKKTKTNGKEAQFGTGWTYGPWMELRKGRRGAVTSSLGLSGRTAQEQSGGTVRVSWSCLDLKASTSVPDVGVRLGGHRDC